MLTVECTCNKAAKNSSEKIKKKGLKKLKNK